MQITVAETAGFCFGVDRAVNMTYSLVDSGKRVFTLGPVIHNPQVIADLENKGVRIISDPSEASEGDTVVVRAHGIAQSVEDKLRAAGADVCDATCPFVAKIHKIVRDNSAPDIPVIIAGDPSHPEVMGIIGHCNGRAYTFSNEADLKSLFEKNKLLCENRIIIVSQTTFSEKVWNNCKKIINLYCTNPIIFDTICLATSKRQREAYELSLKNDIMLIIGGRQSSNTAKLKAVCSENCETHLLERASELSSIDFSRAHSVGITAGASTPAGIIKEVLLEMSENLNVNNEPMVEEVPSEEESFAAMLEANLDQMSTDKHVVGTVIAVKPTEIQVDIGRKQTGLVPVDEYSADPTCDPAKELKVGDELDLIIMKTNDVEGTVTLSKRLFDARKSRMAFAAAAESGEVLEGIVTEVIKGGVIVNSNGATVFVPASQATLRRTQPLEELLKTKVQFVIIDSNRGNRYVGSIRKVRDAARDAFWETVAVDQVYTGTVKSLTAFGAFVEIAPGVEGLAHISELSWKRIKNPAEVLEVGQEIEVYIKALDPEKKKISLGYKKEEDNPWKILEKNYPVGTVLETEIVSVTSFGAFATVIPNIEGLIHISQVADHRIDSVADVLSVGDKVTVKITDIDFEKKRVSLSIRALLEPAVEAEEAAEEAVEAVEEAAEAVEEAAEEAAE